MGTTVWFLRPWTKEQESRRISENFEVRKAEEKSTPSLEHPHEKYPAFTSKVDLNWSKELGRHVVAREAIKPGEIIAVDAAVVGILSPDKYSTNCLHCLASLIRSIPCKHCTAVRFCCASCESSAMQSYHLFECRLGIYDLFLKVGHWQGYYLCCFLWN